MINPDLVVVRRAWHAPRPPAIGDISLRTQDRKQPWNGLDVVVQAGSDHVECGGVAFQIRNQTSIVQSGLTRLVWRMVSAKIAAPPSANSSRFTEVMTACRRRNALTASAIRRGSS